MALALEGHIIWQKNPLIPQRKSMYLIWNAKKPKWKNGLKNILEKYSTVFLVHFQYFREGGNVQHNLFTAFSLI